MIHYHEFHIQSQSQTYSENNKPQHSIDKNPQSTNSERHLWLIQKNTF